MCKVVLSLDDGSPDDEKLVNLLCKYAYNCTLFIPRSNSEGRETVSPGLLRDLATTVEVGSHTLNHVYLTNLPFQRALEEVYSGHDYIQDTTGKSSELFCYPGGKFTKKLDIEISKKIKYRRTIENFRLDHGNSTLIPTFLQFYPHTQSTYRRNIIRYFSTEKINHLREADYLSRIKKQIQSSGPDDIVHVWGHSWEINELNLWSDLITFFEFCKERQVQIKSIGEVYK